MSCNSEHVNIWESKDHKWGIGFFNFVETNEDDPDRDPEWDVEYLFSEVPHWGRGGLRTAEEAKQAWIGPNPGADYEILPYNRENAHDCKGYEEMLRCLHNPEYAEKKRLKDDRAYIRKHAKEALEALTSLPRVGERFHVEFSKGASLKFYSEGRLIEQGNWLAVAPGGEPFLRGSSIRRPGTSGWGKKWGSGPCGVTGLIRI